MLHLFEAGCICETLVPHGAHAPLPKHQILNHQFNKRNNLIDTRFRIGSRKKVSKLCNFLHFRSKHFLDSY